MRSSSQPLVFSPTAAVQFAGNTFIDVPTLLQFDETPIVEVVKTADLESTTAFSIYSSDGVYLAKAVGSRLFRTSDGKKAGVTMRYTPNLNSAQINGKTIFEVRREGPAALAIQAELYAPTGVFVRTSRDIPFTATKRGLELGRVLVFGNLFKNVPVGCRIRSDGSVCIPG